MKLQPTTQMNDPKTFPFGAAYSAAPALWLRQKLSISDNNLGSLVPTGFEAYARIYHPAIKKVGGANTFVSWAKVADSMGTRVHRLMQWPNIAKADYYDRREPLDQDIWTEFPDEGNLVPELAYLLSEILRIHTTTPQLCWFGIWGGYNCINQDPVTTQAPGFGFSGQVCYLFQAPVQAASNSFCADESFPQSANLWWPDDKKWFVATEIDLMSTYVGGSREVINAISESLALESDTAELIDDVSRYSDVIN